MQVSAFPLPWEWVLKFDLGGLWGMLNHGNISLYNCWVNIAVVCVDNVLWLADC